MNKWMIFNKNTRVINTLVVTNGHVQVLRSDGSALTALLVTMTASIYTIATAAA